MSVFRVEDVQRAFARTMGVELVLRPERGPRSDLLPEVSELNPTQGTVAGQFTVFVFERGPVDGGTRVRPWGYGYPERNPAGTRVLTGEAQRANVEVVWFPGVDRATPEIDATWDEVRRALDDLD